MKAKISKGSGFRGVVNYLLDKERGTIIGGNMAGTTQAALSAEFGAVRAIRPDIKKPVWHCSLSLPPGDNLSVEQWQEVAAAFLRKMDICNNQYCIVQHRDKAHQHIHILLNRVTTDGTIWYADRDVYRAIEATRQLEAEKDYLRSTSDRDYTDRKFRPTKYEQGRKRKGQDIPRQQVHDAIRRVIDTASHKLTTREFIELLKAEGIEARPNISSTGRVNGFSFSQSEHKYTGSKVGAKWTQLKQQIDYQPGRDNTYLMGIIGLKPHDLAFAPAEFERYMTVLDKFIKNPTLAVDLRDEIRHFGVSRLTRDIKELNNAHYQQLSELYAENKKVWQKIRSQRPAMRLSVMDMSVIAVMFAVSPAMGALVLLPYVIDKLLRHRRKAQATEISQEIEKIKNEIIRSNQRKDALKELYQSQQQFMEEIKTMKSDERNIIRSNVHNRINTIAKESKNFVSYVDYINQSGIKATQPTYDELATMYDRDIWRGNNAVLRGADTMLDAAATATAERPEMRATYILPMIFDLMARINTDDKIDGQMLERVINDFRSIAPQYIKAELRTEQKEECELLAQTRERNSQLRAQIRKQDIVDRPLPSATPNIITGKISLSKEDYDYLIEIYGDYRKMRVAYEDAQLEKYHHAQEIKKLNEQYNDVSSRLADNQRITNNLSNRCKSLEDRNKELSEDIGIVETFLSEKGLQKPLEDWVEARDKIQEVAQAIQRQQYSSMEM